MVEARTSLSEDGDDHCGGHHSYRKAAEFEIGVHAGAPLAQVTEYVAPAPAVVCDVSAPVIEYVSSAPVIECVAPAPAVTFVVPSQQLPPVYTTTTVTTGDNSDMFSLVYPQFSTTAVEPYAPRVVASLLPLEEFSGPVYDQVHQEQIAASEMTENIAEIPVVQEQVIVGTRPERLVDARGRRGGLERAACPRSSLVAIPCLGGGADGVDVTTTRFLLGMALLQKQEEEEEVRKREEEEEEELKRIRNIPLNQLTPLQRQKLASWIKKEKEKAKAAVCILPSTSSSSSGFIRKRKKKRRKRTRRRC